MFVKSAKINLNRYWNKLENIVGATTRKVEVERSISKKQLRKVINQQLLNNRIFAAKQQKSDEIYGFIPEKFPVPKSNNNSQTTYKPFLDDSLYDDFIPVLMTTKSKLPDNSPCVIDKAYDNYNYYLNECRQKRAKVHHNNDNTLYIQQLNESLRRKGFKFTFADVDRCSTVSDSISLENEGYLV